jgi:hypothetical protein
MSMDADGNPLAKNLLAVLAIAAGGFVLLNLTFIGFFLVVSVVDLVLPGEDASEAGWVLALGLLLSVALVGAVSWRALRSDLSPLQKAIFLTVPLAVIYASLGIALSQWPTIAMAGGAVFFVGLLAFLRRSGQPWFYTCALVLVSLSMLALTLTGTDI